MALKTKVKAGNITNLSDARYCAGMGVDWLSFPIDSVNPTTFKEITDWVTGPQFIIELDKPESIGNISQYPVDTVEISFLYVNLIDQFPGLNCVVTLPLSKWSSEKNNLLKHKARINYLLINPDQNDSQLIGEITSHFHVLIHQTESHSLDELLTLPIEGINVTGQDELRPGLKDFEKLASVLEELEVID